MRKSVTILDIAKLAHASPATVSRVLSNSSYPVSAELKRKIKSAAKELNYTPNLLGRQLKTNNSMTIGIIVPSISNPFYSSIVLGVEEIARANGYQVLLCNSHQDVILEKQFLQTMLEKQVKGVIISSISAEKNLLRQFSDKGICVISIDQHREGEDIYQINYDYRKGGFMAASHLAECGHTKIAFVTAPLDRPSRIYMVQGFRDALRESRILFNDGYLLVSEIPKNTNYNSNIEFENGKTMARRLTELSDRPTAVVACNDLMALGFIYELNRLGVRVPDDVSVIGFDNIDFANISMPPLTTVDHPKYEMGKFSCGMLFQVLNGENVNISEIVLQPKLVIRNSVRVLANC
ncbi:LacI family transcriptional regulator [Gordoniibacillus kamchatkensis]|uniref:LacI family transcriptional regulator n=1 Tax=Gordoniibacillus kamchatkensis TaxID=1590651 RepID=A0ABR5ACS1_9BACL|nr:LacI family DNA-binding transcriptional regulator [Paenibacillus sp. VKM B-2647]KIL38187.1 LacI family transcriptional regulator [Paenibacillus sp. VKM B-2647]